MTIRITGMNSGLDTEAIINELASARSVKVQKIEKNQTKLSWKIDAWKELNTKIYSLYSDVISDMRFDYAYAKKTTKVSNSDAVTVITSGDAMNGVQSMKIKQMAKTGYLTGAKIEASSGEKLLANMEGLGWLNDPSKSVSFKVTVGGEEKEIRLTGYNTLNDVVDKFKEVGLEAKFDTASSRFFITSKETGEAANFTMAPSSADALYPWNENKSFQKVPAYEKVPVEWSNLSGDDKTAWDNKWAAMDQDDWKTKWEEADPSHTTYTTAEEFAYATMRDAAITANANRDQIIADNNALLEEAKKDKVSTGFRKVPSVDEALSEWANLSGDKKTAWDNEWNALQNDSDKLQEWQKKWDALGTAGQAKYSGDMEQFVYSSMQIDAAIEANNNRIDGIENSENEFTSVLKGLGLLTKDLADKYGATLESDKAANMIAGQDAEIELNGATFKSKTNTFDINGLTMTIHKETDEVINLTTEQDTSGIYDTIKNFIKKYSELINEMDKLYNAESASKYEPLTKEEKDALSDTEVEEWEKKIKESLLRRDTTLSSVSSALKTVMLQTSIAGKGGTTISLSYFGIETLGYFKAKDNEKSAYHINGDPDDADVKNYEDKLKKAIATEPDTVIEFFKKLANNLYDTLEDKMAKTDYSSSFTVYNDKQMAIELKEYDSKIATEQKKLNDYIDRWYEKFSQMEVAMGKLNSQQSSISSLFG